MYPLQFIDHIRTCVLVIDPPNFITVHSSDGLKLAIERTLSGVAALGIDCLFLDVGHYFDIDWSNTKRIRWRGSVCIFRNIMSISDLPRNSFGGMNKTTPSSFPSSNYSSFGHPEPPAGPSYLTPQDIQQQSKI